MQVHSSSVATFFHCFQVVVLTLEFDIILNSPTAYALMPSLAYLCFYCLLCKGISGKICTFSKTTVVLNTEKQIEYWINTAKTDLDTAELLIRESRNIHGLFFCHLAIEKALKAHVVKDTGQIPPKTHNLVYLLDLINTEIEESYEDFLGILMKYQLEGRYPDFNPVLPTKEKVIEYLNKTKEMLTWIERKL